jgi:CMP/dCMP kinase
VLEVETRIIQAVAARESAVIVGRGAPHILRGRDNMFRVFVHAPKEYRVAEVERTYHLDANAARQMVERSDVNRAGFVHSLVGRSWTDACLYDLTLDTAMIPPDAAVDLLVAAINAPRRPSAHSSAAS